MPSKSERVILRDARPDDLPRLLELFYQLSQDGHSPEAAVHEVLPAHIAALDALQSHPGARMIVAEADGRVMSTLTTYVMPNVSHDGRPFLIVENVVVDAEARGGGYGRLLMDEAVRIARDAGCYKVGLTSNRKRDPAHAFYEAIGFEHSHKGFTLYLGE